MLFHNNGKIIMTAQ